MTCSVLSDSEILVVTDVCVEYRVKVSQRGERGFSERGTLGAVLGMWEREVACRSWAESKEEPRCSG